ncbi:hypothetical protein JCM1840_007270 [Sporobolomyces johnsonii]
MTSVASNALASSVLAVDTIASCVVGHLVQDDLDPGDYRHLAHYSVLRQASLVCRAWVRPAQLLLFAFLYFSGGTRQLQRWLETVGPGPAPYPSPDVFFGDNVPPEEVSVDKWNFEVVKEVLQKVKGVKILGLCFKGQGQIPAELLLFNGLKGLKTLIIDSPLSTPPTMATPPFQHLETLLLTDYHPKLLRDWSSTFNFLSGTQAGSPPPLLRNLDLRFLPFPTAYLFPELTPFAASLHLLHLPSIDSTRHLWRLEIFAQNCRQLQRLWIGVLLPYSSAGLKLLASSPLPGVWHLQIRNVYGSRGGTHDHSPGAAERDTWAALLQLVANLPDLKLLEIGYARFLYSEPKAELEKLAREKGFRLSIDTIDNGFPAQQEEEFHRVVHLSVY